MADKNPNDETIEEAEAASENVLEMERRLDELAERDTEETR